MRLYDIGLITDMVRACANAILVLASSSSSQFIQIGQAAAINQYI